MAEQATLPSIEEIERASAFTREPFLTEGEDAASALFPGSPRRRALDSALVELEAGAKVPVAALAPPMVAAAGAGSPALAGRAAPRRWHRALGAPGRRAVRHADRAARGPLEERRLGRARRRPGARRPTRDSDEEDDDEDPQEWSPDEAEAEDIAEAPEDPNAGKRFWFEHATGAGKTVAAVGFVEASRTGGILILTHRRNLVDQFHGELRDRGYAKRIAPALLEHQDTANGPVTVETYQWFVRNAGNISDAYSIVICDEAHTALGEKTSAAIRAWTGPVFVGMTATGALIARHVTDLFPTQTSRFDLAQAARRGVISPLRCVRIPPGPGVRTIAKVPLRRGEVDTEFDQEMLAQLLDQLPFNLAIADLYKTRFNGVPGVVYAAGVRHAYNVAQAFRDIGMKAQAVSGETPKRELAQILARYERGDIDVLVNAQLLAEGWNSPRATVCMHLAPTASKRIYQQRVGRVTRRHQGKEAGIVVDFVHPATKHDDPVVSLHSLLDRDVYRGGAIVVGPVRRGRGRRLRVERRVLPVTADENRRIEVFERELWRIAVEHLDYGEQVQWAALAGARVAPTGWRRARAMLHFDQGGELKRTFLITAVDRNKNPALRLRALQEIASGRDAEAFDRALDFVESWPRDDKREGVKVVLQALAEKKIGRRDQANNWIWRCANMTREVHEEYAVQRWPETKRLLGLLVNSSGGAHARNARRLVHAARQQDRRLSAALLAAAIPHTAEAGEVINGARTRMSRKPAALARELLRNFPKGRGKAKRRRRRKGAGEAVAPEAALVGAVNGALDGVLDDDATEELVEAAAQGASPRRRSRRRRAVDADPDTVESREVDADEAPRPRRSRRKPAAEPAEGAVEAPCAEEAGGGAVGRGDRGGAEASRRRTKPSAEPSVEVVEVAAEAPKRRARTKPPAEPSVEVVEVAAEAPKRRARKKPAAEPSVEMVEVAAEAAPQRRARKKPPAEQVGRGRRGGSGRAEAPRSEAADHGAVGRGDRGRAEASRAEEAARGAIGRGRRGRGAGRPEAPGSQAGRRSRRGGRRRAEASRPQGACSGAARRGRSRGRREAPRAQGGAEAACSCRREARAEASPRAALRRPPRRSRPRPPRAARGNPPRRRSAAPRSRRPSRCPSRPVERRAARKPRAKRKPAAKANGPVAEAAAAVEAAVAKRKAPAKRKPRAKKPAAGESLADASERVRAAVEDAAA